MVRVYSVGEDGGGEREKGVNFLGSGGVVSDWKLRLQGGGERDTAVLSYHIWYKLTTIELVQE